jgi:Tfp pilus assembly protein FimT
MKNSLTLIEALLIIGILFILFFVALPNFRFFQKESDLNDSVEEIINTLRLAQNKALAFRRSQSMGSLF